MNGTVCLLQKCPQFSLQFLIFYLFAWLLHNVKFLDISRFSMTVETLNSIVNGLNYPWVYMWHKHTVFSKNKLQYRVQYTSLYRLFFFQTKSTHLDAAVNVLILDNWKLTGCPSTKWTKGEELWQQTSQSAAVRSRPTHTHQLWVSDYEQKGLLLPNGMIQGPKEKQLPNGGLQPSAKW